jgi:hypothetical protein
VSSSHYRLRKETKAGSGPRCHAPPERASSVARRVVRTASVCGEEGEEEELEAGAATGSSRGGGEPEVEERRREEEEGDVAPRGRCRTIP